MSTPGEAGRNFSLAAARTLPRGSPGIVNPGPIRDYVFSSINSRRAPPSSCSIKLVE